MATRRAIFYTVLVFFSLFLFSMQSSSESTKMIMKFSGSMGVADNANIHLAASQRTINFTGNVGELAYAALIRRTGIAKRIGVSQRRWAH